jgi:lysine-N-methylase
MPEKQFRVLAPAYVSNFQCVGSDCPNHCCHSWKVTVNKKSYKQLKKHDDSIILDKAKKHLKLTRKSTGNYAYIKMRSDSSCPFQDPQGLCEIHKRCGHDALPHTCQDYPRYPLRFGERFEMSMTLSCPSVAKEVLFNPSAMMFTENELPASELNHGNFAGLAPKQLPIWLGMVRDFCFATALDENLSFEEKLFVIGILLKQAQPHLDDLIRLEELIANFRTMVGDGTLRRHFASLPSVPTLKWQVFAHQDSKLISNIAINLVKEGKERKDDAFFIECQQPIIVALKPADHQDEQTGLQQGDKKSTLIACNPNGNGQRFHGVLDFAESEYLIPYFDQHPQILINYMLYYLYHFQFMVKEGKTPFQFFRIMVVDILMLKSYLAGIAVQHKGLTEDWVVKLFQSYARRRQHNNAFVPTMEAQLQKAEAESPEAIFGLLK